MLKNINVYRAVDKLLSRSKRKYILPVFLKMFVPGAGKNLGIKTVLINSRWYLYITLLNMKPGSPTIYTIYTVYILHKVKILCIYIYK